MTTTANYILKAVVDGEVFIFQYDEAGDAWEALEQFWHGGDYAEHIARLSGSGEFPVDVIAMDDGKAIRKYEFMFNCAVFDHFFDKGWSASSTEPGQRYTLDQFAKDIEQVEKMQKERIKDRQWLTAKSREDTKGDALTIENAAIFAARKQLAAMAA